MRSVPSPPTAKSCFKGGTNTAVWRARTEGYLFVLFVLFVVRDGEEGRDELGYIYVMLYRYNTTLYALGNHAPGGVDRLGAGGVGARKPVRVGRGRRRGQHEAVVGGMCMYVMVN